MILSLGEALFSHDLILMLIVSFSVFYIFKIVYNKRLLYRTYDVTKQLVVGKNVVGTILGNRWYKGNLFTFN